MGISSPHRVLNHTEQEIMVGGSISSGEDVGGDDGGFFLENNHC